MKTTYKTLSLALLSLALLDASVSSLSAQSTRLRPVALEAHEVELTQEFVAPETVSDADFPFFASIRAWRGAEQFATYETSVGWNNVHGWYQKDNYHIAYVTEILLDETTGAPVLDANNQPIPLKLDVYVWAEQTSFNGEKLWVAAYLEFDATTGKFTGYWWSYGKNDPATQITGAGSFSGFHKDEINAVIDANGWILVPQSKHSKRKGGLGHK